MEKETFKVLVSRHEARIQRANREIEKLTKFYINSNKKFSIGDKIKITTPSHKTWSYNRKREQIFKDNPETFKYAFVKDIIINTRLELSYLLRSAKKDGTESKISTGYWDKDILELYND